MAYFDTGNPNVIVIDPSSSALVPYSARVAATTPNWTPYSSQASPQASQAPNVKAQDFAANAVDSVQKRWNEGKQRLKDIAAKAPQNYEEAVQNIRKTGITSRGLGATGAVGIGALGAVQQLSQDQPLGAAAATVGSIGAGAIAQNLVSRIPGPWGGVARVAAPIAASFLGGNLAASGAEGLKNMVTGQQTGKKSETQKTEAPLFGPGGVPLNDAARFLAMQDQLQSRQLAFNKAALGNEVGAQKDLLQFTAQQQILLSKSLQPVIEQAKTNDQVRTQALMNTQGNIETRLGILATQGALAKGAQAEAGALARTFAGSNPYAQFAVRQSPNIQFG
jgi:hypothetical protein